MTTEPTISEQVDLMMEGMAAHAPAEVLAAFGTELAALDTAGVPTGTAGVGTTMPDGTVLDTDGAPTTLHSVLGNHPAVVVFYRGAWCPYCNIALKTYQEQLVPALTVQGIQLVAISPQKPDGSLSMKQAHALTFKVLSDPGNTIAGALGILSGPTEDVKAAQTTLGLDLAEVNADGTYGLPMPTVLVVDGAGVIRWIDIHPNYSTRTEPASILAAVAELL